MERNMTNCPKCHDTGLADTGATYPWGEGITTECDCKEVPEEFIKAFDTAFPADQWNHQVRELMKRYALWAWRKAKGE